MNSLLFLIMSFVIIAPSDEEIPNYWLPGIIVTAKRVDEPLSEVAVDMRVITNTEIKKKGIKSIDELLSEEGYIDVRKTGIEGGLLTVGLRGFSANHTLVLLNGIPLNSPANGCFDFSEIPIESIKRIEIVKSPSSSLYGSNASSGVINIVTETEEKKGFGLRSTGSVTQQGANHLSGKVFYVKDVSKTNINISKRQNKGLRPNSSFNSISANGNVSFFDFIKTGFFAEKKGIGIPGPVPPADNVPTYGDSEAYSLFDNQKTKNYIGYATIVKNLGDVNFSLMVGYKKENLNYSSIYEGWSGEREEDNWYYTTEQLTGSFKLLFREVTAGIDVMKQEFWAYDTLINGDTDSLQNVQFWNPFRKTKGFWSSLRHRFFNNRIKTSASIRWDKNSDFPDFLSYSGGILLKVMDNLRIGLSSGKGFRAPTFNELYWPGSGNSSLKPEESFQSNIHLDARIRNAFFLRLSGFKRKVKNAVSWINYKPENVNILTVKGIEINPTVNIHHFLSLSLSGAMKKATEETGAGFPLWVIDGKKVRERRAGWVPDKKFTGSVELRKDKNTVFVFAAVYTGEKVAYFYDFVSGGYKTKRIDDVSLFNLNINHRFGERFSFSLRIDNLFDKEYKTNFGYTLDDKDYPGERRTISLGFDFTLM